MTPKQKASELFRLMREVIKQQPDGTFSELNKAAKQCALIVVEEILVSLIKSNPNYESNTYWSPIDFWQNVKIEIQKL